MNSKTFYKHIAAAVNATMNECGFERNKRSYPCWQQRIGSQVLHLMIKTGKYPWQDYIGGNFSLYAFLRAPDAELPQAGEWGALYVFDYADEPLQQRVLVQNRAAYKKAVAWDMSQLSHLSAVEQQLARSQRALFLPIWRDEVESDRPWIVVNKELFYTDEADIQAWGEIVLAVFARVAEQVRGGVVLGG